MLETSPDAARTERPPRLTREAWREVFTPWSEVADADIERKHRAAVFLVAFLGASWLENHIGLAAWALALAFVYLVACFARWRHFRRGPGKPLNRADPPARR